MKIELLWKWNCKARGSFVASIKWDLVYQWKSILVDFWHSLVFYEWLRNFEINPADEMFLFGASRIFLF